MRFYRGIVVVLAAVGAAPFTAAAANRRESFDDLAAGADKIVLGTVAAKGSRWADDGHIYTDVLVSPDVTIKGAEEGPVAVEVLGGTVGDTTMTVSDGPEFPDGQRLVVFLRREGAHYVVVGRAAGAVAATSSEAGEAVESAFRAAERGAARRLEYQRGLAGASLNRAIAHAATQTGCYGTDGAKWATTSATYRIGTTIPADWAASIDASAATWNGAQAGFKLINDPGSVNELSYKDLVATYGSSYSNTLALTTTWSSTSTGKISKAIIEVNTKWPWSTSGEANMADVQNILTHEFGHWMRLLDIYSPSTCSEVTMWGSAAYGETKKRTLEQPDLDGFASLYGGGAALAAPALASPANGATGVAAAVSLVWTAAANATSYDVYFGTASSLRLIATVATTNYQPGTLAAGTYSWRIVAKNSAGSAASATYSFTVGSGALAAPALLSPANGATGVSKTAALVWAAAASATSYDVYFGPGPTPALVATVTGTTYQPGTLADGTTYSWRVVAKNSTGSAASATYSFQTAPAASPVAAPTLTAPANGATGLGTTVTLAWTAAANATSYDIYFGATSTPALAANTSATSIQALNLKAATTYYWRVVGKNSTGSAASATFSFTVAAAATGQTLTLLSPANGATGVSLRPIMQWTAVTGATAYDLYVGATAAPPYIGTTNATSVTVMGFQPKTVYYWNVVAKTPSGSVSSAVASFKTN